MEKMTDYKKRTIREWILSYLLMFFIPLVFFVLFIISGRQSLIDDIEYYNSLSVEYVSKLFDAAFLQNSSLTGELLLDNDIKDLINTKNGEEIHPYSFYEASQRVNTVCMANELIESAIVYSPSQAWYVGPGRYGKISSLDEDFNLHLEKDVDEVFLKERRANVIYNASYTNQSGKEVNRILLVRPLSFVSPSGLYVASVINVDKIIGKSDKVSSFKRLSLYSSDGSFLYDFSGENDGRKLSEIEHDDRGYITIIRKSDSTSFTYAVRINRQDYFHTSYILVIIFFVYIILALILGSLVVMKKVKRDWEILSNALENKEGTETVYSPFVSSLNKLSAEKEGLEDVIHIQTESLKKSTIEKLLNNTEDSSLISQSALKECGIVFVSDYFMVYLAETNEDSEKLIKEKFLAHNIKTFSYSSSSSLAFILSFEEDYAADKATLYADISLITEELVSSSIINDASSSSLTKGINNLGSAYLDAINAMEYKKNNDIHGFVTYEDVVTLSNNIKYEYSSDDALSLINAVTSGSGEEAIKIIRRVMKSNEENGVSPRHLRYLLFTIANTVLKAYTRLEETFGQDIGIFTLPPIIRTKNLEMTRMVLEEKVKVLTEMVINLRNKSGDLDNEHYKIYKKALALIENNYQDVTLNVSSLSEDMGVSIAFLSKVFKKYHTMNISDYIARYRVEKSKALLLEGVPLSEIVEKCGFGSLRTYMRLFKKFEDATPGAYRIINKEYKNE